MKVAICHTKKTNWGRAVAKAFRKGVGNSGDDPIDIYNESHLTLMQKCDVIFQVCVANHARRHNIFRFRHKVKAAMQNHQPIITAESGFVKGYRMALPKLKQGAYVSICVDGMKREGNFYNQNSPPDRWLDLQIPLKPWRKDGKYILVLGQPNHSGHLYPTKVVATFENMMRCIRQYTDRPFIFRRHPIQDAMPKIKGLQYKSTWPQSSTLTRDLSKAWCAITIASNSAIEAIIEGIPVINEDARSMVYDVAEHFIKNVENPMTPDRSQWAYDLAYAQWNIDEITQGDAWRHLRPHIIDRVPPPIWL